MLEPCDVIFVRKKRESSFIDRLIQRGVKWATGSEFFHVAYFYNGQMVFEANSFRTAGFALITDYADYEVKRLDLPLVVRERILTRIIQTTGAGYGWGEVIALLLRKKFGINVFYDDRAKYICSGELFDAAYAETGIRITGQSTDDVSPQDLWESPWLLEV